MSAERLVGSRLDMPRDVAPVDPFDVFGLSARKPLLEGGLLCIPCKASEKPLFDVKADNGTTWTDKFVVAGCL